MQQFVNWFQTTLAADLSDIATVVSVVDASGLSLGAGEYYLAVIQSTTGQEIVKISEVLDQTTHWDLTIQRAQEGSIGMSFLIGDVLEIRVTAGTLDNLVQQIELETYAYDKATVYTKTETDGLATLTNFYNKTETDALSSLSNYYLKSETYTQAEVDGITGLANYYETSQTYTKSEVDGIASLTNFYNKTWVDGNLYQTSVIDQRQGLKNRLVNGSGHFWSQGAGPAAIPSGNTGESMDHWLIQNNAGVDLSWQRSATIPFKSFGSTLQLTATSVASAGSFCVLHRIAGKDAAFMGGQSYTFSFAIKDNLTADNYGVVVKVNYATALNDFSTVELADSLDISTSVQGLADATWGEMTGTFTLPASTTNGDPSKGVEFCLELTKTGATENLNFELSNFQLEVGSVATDLDFRSKEQEEVLADLVHPIGSIIAVHPWAPVPDVDRWTLCDGIATLGDKFVGHETANVPVLTDGRFLQGSTTEGTGGGTLDKSLWNSNQTPHSHATVGHSHTVNAHSHNLSAAGQARVHVNSTGNLYLDTEYTGFTANYAFPSIGSRVEDSSSTAGSATLQGTTDSAVSSTSSANPLTQTSSISWDSVTVDVLPKYFNVKYYIKLK